MAQNNHSLPSTTAVVNARKKPKPLKIHHPQTDIESYQIGSD